MLANQHHVNAVTQFLAKAPHGLWTVAEISAKMHLDENIVQTTLRVPGVANLFIYRLPDSAALFYAPKHPIDAMIEEFKERTRAAEAKAS